MSFRLARRKLRPLEWIQKCWMHFYCFLVKEITKLAEIFTGWFYYISRDSCKVWKHLQTLYQCCAWVLKYIETHSSFTVWQCAHYFGRISLCIIILFLYTMIVPCLPNLVITVRKIIMYICICMSLWIYWPAGLLQLIASHPQAKVHLKSFLKQVHRAVLHFDLHPQVTSSRQASGIGIVLSTQLLGNLTPSCKLQCRW